VGPRVEVTGALGLALIAAVVIVVVAAVGAWLERRGERWLRRHRYRSARRRSDLLG